MGTMLEYESTLKSTHKRKSMSSSNLTQLRFLLAALVFCWVLKNPAQCKNPGEPVPGAEIYVELEPDDEPIFFQPDFQTVTENPDGTITVTFSFWDDPAVVKKHTTKLKVTVDLIKFLKIQPNESEVDGFMVFSYNNRGVKKAVHYSSSAQSSKVLIEQVLPMIPQTVVIKGERVGQPVKKDLAPAKTTKGTK